MISKCKQTQAITIMKLILDTDVKTNERHIGVATCMCETQPYAIAIHCHLFGEKKCSLKFQLIFADLCFYGARSRCLHLLFTTRLAKSFHTDNN